MRGAYRVLVERPQGKKSLGRPRHRWEDNIKTDLQDVQWGMDRTDMTHDRDRWYTLVNAVGQLKCACVFPRSLRGPYTLLPTNRSAVITVCTTSFVIKRYALRPQNVYTVSCDSHKKQRLLSRKCWEGRCQWSPGLRGGSSAALLLGLWVRIPPAA